MTQAPTTKSFAKLALLGAALLLAGCDQSAFVREAGNMDPGSFGNATMQNTMMAKGHMQPVISHDKYDPAPGSTSRLNGKYAFGIWQNYTGSGTAEASGAADASAPAPAAPPAAP